MITKMSGMQYKISYAPPVQVKDEPHRVHDTFDSVKDVNIPSDDYGTLSIVGDSFEIESDELTPQDAAAALA
jgi:hypothetical protein